MDLFNLIVILSHYSAPLTYSDVKRCLGAMASQGYNLELKEGQLANNPEAVKLKMLFINMHRRIILMLVPTEENTS